MDCNKEMNGEEWTDFLINKEEKTDLCNKLCDDLECVFWSDVSRSLLHNPGGMTDQLIGYRRTVENIPEPTKEEYECLKSALLMMAEKLKDAAGRL